jgi:hypothetical protein
LNAADIRRGATTHRVNDEIGVQYFLCATLSHVAFSQGRQYGWPENIFVSVTTRGLSPSGVAHGREIGARHWLVPDQCV